MQAPNPPAPQMTAAQQDSLATNALRNGALNRIIAIAGSQTVYPASQPQINIQPTNVGLLKRFLIKVSGSISNTGTVAVNLSDTGLANIFSNVQYIDLNSFTRVNTTGLHLTAIANAKRRRPMGGCHQVNTANGNNLSQVFNAPAAEWGVFSAPASIAAGASGAFQAYFEVPIAYSDSDFRGAIYTSVLQAIQQLILTPNPNPITAGTADDTFAVYTGAAGAAGNIANMTVTVYQNYLDQLPVYSGQVLLPAASMSNAYLLLNTPYQGLPQNQEFPVNYANQRQFLSTFALYNSTGAQGGRLLGSDVNYFALGAANAMKVWQYDPYTAALLSREELDTDLPAGMYYFSHRKRAISTSQFGNMQFVINPSTSSASSKLQMMYEMMSPLSTLVSGQSVGQP